MVSTELAVSCSLFMKEQMKTRGEERTLQKFGSVAQVSMISVSYQHEKPKSSKKKHQFELVTPHDTINTELIPKRPLLSLSPWRTRVLDMYLSEIASFAFLF